MKNQCQHLTATQRNELLTKNRRDVRWDTWHLENRSSRLQTKRGCEADIFKIICSNKGIQGNVKKKVKRLVLLGVLERANESEWGDPSFTQPKPK